MTIMSFNTKHSRQGTNQLLGDFGRNQRQHHAVFTATY